MLNHFAIVSILGPSCVLMPCWLQMSEKMEQSEKMAEEGLVDEAQALLADVSYCQNVLVVR